MGKIRFSGPLGDRLSSLFSLGAIALAACVRNGFGRRLEPTWNIHVEIGVRFVRRQFERAIRHPDIVRGRQIFDGRTLR
jgi:hypothetical protein